MKRFRDDRPADICFARGTFNSHPYVMAAMQQFLQHLDTPEARESYRDLDRVWNERSRRLNLRLRDEALPVQVANMSSIWTVCYTQPSRYNWMLQYYLRAEGLALSWVGTGRLIFSLNYTDDDFEAVADRFVAAAGAMQQRWLVVERSGGDEQIDQAPDPEGDDRASDCPRCAIASGARLTARSMRARRRFGVLRGPVASRCRGRSARRATGRAAPCSRA